MKICKYPTIESKRERDKKNLHRKQHYQRMS